MISFSRTLAIALLAASLNLQASDLAKEKRWADQIVDALIDGEAVYQGSDRRERFGTISLRPWRATMP